MTTQDIKTMIATIGVPYAYRQFTKETAKAPPFICFFFDGSDNFDADDCVFQRVESLIVEIYTDTKDFALEEQAEAVFDANHLPWEKTETVIETEQMHETIYTLSVMLTPSHPIVTT